MIVRFSAQQLRAIAAQLDALIKMEDAGADHLTPSTTIKVGGLALAYAHWWEDEQEYLAEVIDFTPGSAAPLAYHGDEISR